MNTGTLRFNDKLVISNQLTKAGFLQHVGTQAEMNVANPPYFSYRLPPLLIENVQTILVIYFKGERVQEVHLYPLWEDSPRSWGQYDLAQEENRKKQNDAFLRQIFGEPPYQYNWGGVTSIIDKKAGHSEIIIRYK